MNNKLIRDKDASAHMRFVIFRAQNALDGVTSERIAALRVYVKSLTTFGAYVDKSMHLPLSAELMTSITNAIKVFEDSRANLNTTANLPWLTSVAVGVSRKIRKEIQPYVPEQFLPKIETGAGYHEDASAFKQELFERSADLTGLVRARTRQLADFGKQTLSNVSIITTMLDLNPDATISSPVCAEIRAFYDLIEDGALNLLSADLENLFNRSTAIITALVDVEGFALPPIAVAIPITRPKRPPAPKKVLSARPRAPENAAIH